MLPKRIESLWTATTPETSYPEFRPGTDADVAIVGGGIAGLTAAYFLVKAGRRVVLIDSSRIATGTSGNTTAKITSQHNLKYAFLRKHFGPERAKIYADSNQWAIEEMERIIRKENIDCDFVRAPAYVYALTDSELKSVEREVEVCEELGLPASFVDKDEVKSVPFPIKGAIEFSDQAYFHPRKYLLAMAEKIREKGGHIFENTQASDIRTGDVPVVVTDKGEITAKKVIVATNYPFFDKGLFFVRMSQSRSYAIATKPTAPSPKGMFINNEGKILSFRSHKSKEKEWLIIGGEGHVVGESEGEDHFSNLEKTATEKFALGDMGYVWASQDSMTIDRIPYIGKMPFVKNVFVTTGYGKWGMTTSVVSARILTDLILERKNEWAKFYRPSRFNLTASFSGLMESLGRIMKNFFKSAKKENTLELADMDLGGGKVITYKGEKAAIYKDEKGNISARSAVCTHLGCIVNWNGTEKTWDCPCHGSRFTKEGEVIRGPAAKPLEEIEISE